jgi:hypothetical protein
LDCCCYDSHGKLRLEAAAGKPSESKRPCKIFGVDKSIAFMQTIFEAYVKARRKPVSLRSARGETMTPVIILTVNRKLGTATRDLV